MKYRIITIWLFCMMTFSVVAQQYKTVLPYRMVGGKMIVEMIMNGTPRSFIFDTGGRTALTGEICEELGLTVTDSLVVTDVNSNQATYPIVVIESLLTPDGKINFKGVPALQLAQPSPFECFHADGLIGSDLLARTIVEIDGKAKTVTITSAEKASTISLRKMIPFVKAGMPLISLQAGVGNNITCLFDTGCPGFFSLKNTDFEVLKSAAAFNILSEGYGEGSIGVAGMAAADVSYRVRFPLISVGSTKFKNVSSETSTPPFTLLGVRLLDYGKVTLDYPRTRFYFEAYEPENDLESKHYNVALRVKDGELFVSTVWSAMKGIVEVGDKVTKINGKPTGKYDFCESIINGIPELKAKKKTKLTIRTRQGEKVIVYEKE
ncbi:MULTISPECIES: aspartyl protease family protein [Butyricimonas]|uniref:aspartyl protease family protein n=1 Tax=Butyricimonas TaxID=574697 RepID=UPI001D05D94A|nr:MULTISPECIES: aspartyl protease family protein [Butyricimonas]MCB6972646.1 aspartyl protease family protein [Butyricimonas synergistica]MCG4519654.1 aspartyl protease family protein [Butyricimonas sp. DFI.6.44]